MQERNQYIDTYPDMRHWIFFLHFLLSHFGNHISCISIASFWFSLVWDAGPWASDPHDMKQLRTFPVTGSSSNLCHPFWYIIVLFFHYLLSKNISDYISLVLWTLPCNKKQLNSSLVWIHLYPDAFSSQVPMKGKDQLLSLFCNSCQPALPSPL